MLTSGYYAWDIQAMIPRSAVPHSVIELSPPVYVEGEVTQVPKAPIEGASRTTDTAVRVTKFDVAFYRHEDVLHRVSQMNDPEVVPRAISNAPVLFLYNPALHMGLTPRGEHSPSQPPPRRVISRRKKVSRWPLLEFSSKLLSRSFYNGDIVFNRCLTFRRAKTPAKLRLLCWYSVSHDTTAAQSLKRKRSS